MEVSTDTTGTGTPGKEHPPASAGLICEGCGYALDGLPSAAVACPECGLPIAESHPERRTGTPWQRRQGAGPWLATNWAVLRRPGRTFATARMTRAGSVGLLRLNVLAAALVLAGGWCVHMIRLETFIALFPPTWWRMPISAAAIALILGLPAALASLWGLTWIEVRGIRFIGGRRGWRITPDAAWTICAHASVGWIVAAALGAAGLMATWLLDIQPTKQTAPNTFTYDPLRPWRPPIGGFMIGLILFEVLVNVGVRRCRYANSQP